MQYLTQKELKEMMFLSRERVEAKKEEINKINVFPVPDQDTGNNMVKTLAGIETAIADKEFKDVSEISEVILDGALTAAQGNAGVIYTGFLAGFLPELDKNPVDCQKLTLAFEKGSQRARESIQDPKEGTILDVIDAVAFTFKEEVGKGTSIINTFKKAVENANEALLATREKMEIFKKANVVDAGGLGFLIILESFLEALEKPSFVKATENEKEKLSEKTRMFIQVLSNRYEIVCLLESPNLELKAAKEKLKGLGNSIDIVLIGNKMKIHIHTDYPDEVKSVLRNLGQIQDLRMEDMAKEVVGEESVKKVSIGIVTGNGAMLLPKIAERYWIEQIFIKYHWSEEKSLEGKNIYQKMRGVKQLNIQDFSKVIELESKDFLTAFKKQFQKFKKVLCITTSSKVSKNYNLAQEAKEMVSDQAKVFVFDSQNIMSGQSLLVLRTVELIQEQREMNEVIKELKKLTPQVRTHILIKDTKWAEKEKLMPKSYISWMKKIKKLKLFPIIEIKNGAFAKGGAFLGKDMSKVLVKKILKTSKTSRKKGKKIRVIIGHADNLKQAKKLKKALKERISVDIPFINLMPLSIGAILGPGALIVSWIPLEI